MADIDEKKQYRLFVLPPDTESIKVAESERFYRLTPRYALVYTQNEPKMKHAEITKSEAGRLSDGDMRWFRDCLLAIFAEAALEHEKSIAAEMNAKLDRLEAALKAEKEKQEKE